MTEPLYPHDHINGEVAYKRANCPVTCSSVTGTGIGSKCRCGCEKPKPAPLRTATLPCGILTVSEGSYVTVCENCGLSYDAGPSTPATATTSRTGGTTAGATMTTN